MKLDTSDGRAGMRRFGRGIAVTALLVLVATAPVWAQATARLSGRVTDQSSAVLPGVTVTATQTDTGLTRTTVTDGTGSYVLPALPVGPYRLEVALQGFQSYVQTGIVLQVGDNPVINAALGLSTLEETVTVEAAAPIVDVQSAGIGEVVQNEEILALPLNGRNPVDLIALAGAAVQTGTSSTRSMSGGVSYSVAGGLSAGVAYILDGAIHNNPHNNQNLPFPFPDALQEFRVATGGLSAENGVHSGASVNAVTKSGTNRFSGNLFEFLRDKRFNAPEHFAAFGPDGEQEDDGLNRNQYGGTLGGPILQDRVFFFGGYQATRLRQTPASNIGYVPTAAMLAGDFTAFASPACNGGRQITLRAPFVNNTINPALFSPASVNLAGRLPSTSDPCGEITYSQTQDQNDWQAVSKVDVQASSNHSLFGRYIVTSVKQDPAFVNSPDNVLTVNGGVGVDNMANSVTFGDTLILGSNTVHAFRFAFNRSAVQRLVAPYFQPSDLGIQAYNYSPVKEIGLAVDDGFSLGGGTSSQGIFNTNDYQVADDITVVRGAHQFSIGGNAAYWKSEQESHARSAGAWTFDGNATGLGLADLMLGRLARLEHGGPSGAQMGQTYLGLYAQDAWKAGNRVTVNLGLRWEPFFGQVLRDGAVTVWSQENFDRGIHSTVFNNAPAGLLYYGDEGFPDSKTGMKRQWLNFSPRLGLAWDVSGDGRTAVRASYAISYDFPNGEVHLINATSPPFGNRLSILNPPGGWDDPYAELGGDPHPIITNPDTVYPLNGSIGTIDPNINSPRIQQWSLTVERQLGDVWQAAATYLGSYSDRLWGTIGLNPGLYLGPGPCTVAGPNGTTRTLARCDTRATLDARRVLRQQNYDEAQYIGFLDQYVSRGTQDYRGLKLSIRRRAANGLSINGNYTLGRCFGNATPDSFLQLGDNFKKPDDPSFDAGHCAQDRKQIGNLTMGYVTPAFANTALRVLASDWRISGTLSARSGSWLNVTTGTTGDDARNGIRSQVVNQLSDDVYGPGKDASDLEPGERIDNYLNKAAFERAAPGTYGNFEVNSIEGPGFWNVNLAVARLLRLSNVQTVELRVEAFNLFNTFNWGNPNTIWTSAAFGRITSQSGDPRILQFGVKYGF